MEIPWDQIIELISFVYKICVSRYIRINQETTTILTEMLNAAMCKWDSILYFENFWHIFLQSVKFYIVLYFRWPFFGRVTEFISFLPGLEIQTGVFFHKVSIFISFYIFAGLFSAKSKNLYQFCNDLESKSLKISEILIYIYLYSEIRLQAIFWAI